MRRTAGQRARRVLLEPLESRVLLTANGLEYPQNTLPSFSIPLYPGTLTAADVDGDGLTDLVSCSTSLDSSISVLRNQGDGTFADAVSYPIGGWPADVIAADVNGDGKVDLIVAQSCSNTVSVLLNQGNGTFLSPVTYAAGKQATSVAAADVDGDGTLDLITANSGDNTVSVFRNQGDGAFAAQVTYAVGFAPSMLTVGDFDGDGRVDLVTAGCLSQSLSLLRNAGNGTFATAVNESVPGCVYSLTAADVNGDGALDLLASDGTNHTILVLRNQGNGTFATAVSYAVPVAVNSLGAADLDGDGALDLFALGGANGTEWVVYQDSQDYQTGVYFPGSVFVLRNQGEGTFAAPVAYVVDGEPSDVVALDLDRDGDLDLAVTNASLTTGSVQLLENLEDGHFAGQMLFGIGDCPMNLTSADLDGDGDLDLVAANGMRTISVLLNQGDGTFAPQVQYAAEYGSNSVSVADLDGDGDLDLLCANQYSNTLSVYLNHGDGTFDAQVTYETVTEPTLVTVADLDGDGDHDLLVSSEKGGYALHLNRGNGTFASPEIWVTVIFGSENNTLYHPTLVTAADLDGDGDLDLAVVRRHLTDTATDSAVLRRLLADTVTNCFVGGSPVYIEDPPTTPLVDVDLDPSGDLQVLWNQGNGTFSSGDTYSLAYIPTFLQAADVDGDGDLDLLTLSKTASTLLVLKNHGNGTFADPVSTQLPKAVNSATVVDFDGDGDIDIITSSYELRLLRNQGDGTFVGQFLSAQESGPHAVVAADLDGNGTLDLATADYNSNTVTVLRNLSVSTATTGTTTRVTTDHLSGSVYGQAVTITATVTGHASEGSVPTGFVQFFIDGSNFGSPVALNGQTTSIVISSLSAGSHAIEACFLSADTATFPSSQGTTVLEVTPAPLLITVLNKTKVYGEINPGFSVNYRGWVNGDSATSLALQPTLTSTATTSSHVGRYPITAQGAASANYTITYVSGTLSVTPASLTIRADNLMTVAGSPLPTLTATYVGWVNGDTPASLRHVAVLSTTATANSPVGTYTIQVAGARSSDYVIKQVSGKLTILAPQTGAFLTADPQAPTQRMLTVLGTSGNDRILLRAGSRAGDVVVWVNGQVLGTYSPTSRIVVHGQAGNDRIQVLNSVTIATWLYGDEGNDQLQGGGGASLLLGGSGNDLLQGGKGRSILIGGTGQDNLDSAQGESILLGSVTAYDSNDQALLALLSEWNSSDSYASRLNRLSGASGGQNGVYQLTTATVQDDALRDWLRGSAGRKWYFQGPNDKVYNQTNEDALVVFRTTP